MLPTTWLTTIMAGDMEDAEETEEDMQLFQ